MSFDLIERAKRLIRQGADIQEAAEKALKEFKLPVLENQTALMLELLT